MAGIQVRIRIRSHLDERWTAYFDGLAIRYETDDETVLTGALPDQAALFGTLMKLRDLGLALVALEPVEDLPGEE